MKVLELIWPTLRPISDEEQTSRKIEDEERVASIRSLSWNKDDDVALDESRRIVDAERERRRSADTRAAVYLAAIAAAIPILSGTVPLVLSSSVEGPLRYVSSSLLLVALVYLARAAMWAFQSLKTAVGTQVDVDDLKECWQNRSPKAQLIRELLISVPYNWGPVNRKISSNTMTREFLIRAIVVMFGLVSFPVLFDILEYISSLVGSVITNLMLRLSC